METRIETLKQLHKSLAGLSIFCTENRGKILPDEEKACLSMIGKMTILGRYLSLPDTHGSELANAQAAFEWNGGVVTIDQAIIMSKAMMDDVDRYVAENSKQVH
jgi:hypothetical protein